MIYLSKFNHYAQELQEYRSFYQQVYPKAAEHGRVIGLPEVTLTEGGIADLTVIDLNRPHNIDSTTFKSLGRATPFDGWGVSCDIALTVCGGKVVYENLNTQEEQA